MGHNTLQFKLKAVDIQLLFPLKSINIIKKQFLIVKWNLLDLGCVPSSKFIELRPPCRSHDCHILKSAIYISCV